MLQVGGQYGSQSGVTWPQGLWRRSDSRGFAESCILALNVADMIDVVTGGDSPEGVQ